MTRRVLTLLALTVLAVAVLAALVVALPFYLSGRLWRWLDPWRSDPVDEHYLTAAAVLAPDSLPDCICEDCEFERIAAANPDLAEIGWEITEEI